MSMTETVHFEDFCFGPGSGATAEVLAFWKMHGPVVRAWIGEMVRAGDPWWQSAGHAASCLVVHREWASEAGGELGWGEFHVQEFLFHDLQEGGTVGFYGSVPIFFDQLVEAFERFVHAGIIDADKGATWLAEMRAARPRFLDHYRDCEEEVIDVYGAKDTLRTIIDRDRRD